VKPQLKIDIAIFTFGETLLQQFTGLYKTSLDVTKIYGFGLF